MKLFLCGDVMTGRGIDQILPHSCSPELHEQYVDSALEYVALAEQLNGPIPRQVGFDYVWGAALDLLADARPDVRIINLETAITDRGHPFPKGINYRMHPGNTPVLQAAEIDCCVLANNHVLDWGEVGLRDTLDALSSAGILFAGAGSNRSDAEAPATISVSEGRVLVFAFGSQDSGVPLSWHATAAAPGVCVLQDFSMQTASRIGTRIQSARSQGDVVVVSLHWGGNWGYEIPHEHRRFAHALIDQGCVDIVHGHSSHHPRAIELYRGRLILYGCGDLLNDYEGIRGYASYRDDLALLYLPTLDTTGQLLQLELIPLRIQRFRLNLPSGSDREWLRQMLDRECRKYGHHVNAVDDGFRLA